mgnify:CR=1 FL=1
MERYGFSEEELAGIDVIQFIRDYQLESRQYSKEEILAILESEADAYIDDGTTQIFLILEQPGRKLTNEDTIITAGFYLNEGTAIDKVVCDLENNVFYYNTPDAYHLSQELKEELLKLSTSGKLRDWELHTEGKEGPSTGSYYWILAFETKNGEFCTYDGFTRDMSHLPDGYYDVKHIFDEIIASIPK